MKNHRAKTTMCREYNDQYSKREKKDKEREEKRMGERRAGEGKTIGSYLQSSEPSIVAEKQDQNTKVKSISFTYNKELEIKEKIEKYLLPPPKKNYKVARKKSYKRCVKSVRKIRIFQEMTSQDT